MHSGSTEYVLMNSSIKKLNISHCQPHTATKSTRSDLRKVPTVARDNELMHFFWTQKAQCSWSFNDLKICDFWGCPHSLESLAGRFRSTLAPTPPAQLGLHLQPSCLQVNQNFPATKNANLCKTLKHYSRIPHLLYYLLVILVMI